MDPHTLYTLVLEWCFAALSYLRICAYLPTLRLLLRKDARGDDYSLLTWVVWTLSHLAFALMLLEQGAQMHSMLVAVTALNTLMCAVTCSLILRLRWRRQGHRHVGDAPPAKPRRDDDEWLSPASTQSSVVRR